MSVFTTILPLQPRTWRLNILALLFIVTAVFLTLALGSLLWGTYQWHLNLQISALKANEDIAVSPNAHPKVLTARIKFLLDHDRIDEAQPYVEALDKSGSQNDRAMAHYNLANARLRQAFDLLAREKLDTAGSYVILARQDYRKALTQKPDYWDAKYNLDVASRLIRDFPAFERTTGDTVNMDRTKIWTDIPGKPEGLP